MKPIKFGRYEICKGCFYQGKYTIGYSKLLGVYFSYFSEKYHSTIYYFPKMIITGYLRKIWRGLI